MKTKRHIASWVLLAVFVPMLVFSSLHVHVTDSTVQTSCTECIHHHCGGHMGQQTTSIHACVLCQFLTLTMLSAAIATLTCYFHIINISPTARYSTTTAASCGVNRLRAPPASRL